MLCRKDLDADSIKEPRCVRRNIRRLVGPVIEVVVAEQADIGDEDSRVHVDSMQGIEVVSAICFGEIAVSICKVPLAARWAGVVTWRRR